MLLQTLRENADEVGKTGEYALRDARRAGVAAYYSNPALGAGIVKEMPDGSRFLILVNGDEDVVLETLTPRR